MNFTNVHNDVQLVLRRLYRQFLLHSYILLGDSTREVYVQLGALMYINIKEDKIGGLHPPSPSLNAKGWPCQESLVGVDRGSVLFQIKDKTILRPGTTQKVQVYYPTASRDPSRFQYFVEGTDRWGNLPKANLPVGCEVLDGVLPLHHHQQGYGGTQTVNLVNNTQEKQVYFQQEIIA